MSLFTHVIRLLFFVLLFCQHSLYAQTNPDSPNILLIIADDMGTDVTNGYEMSSLMPTTPNIDGLRTNGLTFKNAWAAPKCTPSRAALLSGKFGVKTGVIDTPGNLDLSHTSIFNAIAAGTGNLYADAVIGKWHIASPQNVSHVTDHGVDHFEGFLSAGVPDYYNWTEVDESGNSNPVTDYVTTHLTDKALGWINARAEPWMMVLSHAAPHTPYHIPPSSLFTTPQTNTNRQKFVAAIEAMDTEIGRLLAGIPVAVRNNTLIVFLGDNGSPNNVLQTYPTGHGKNSLYQGGVRVPLIVSGAGVTRSGQEEQAMVHVADLYATLLEQTGGNLEGGIYNSLSFSDLLSSSGGNQRPYNYSELGGNTGGWTISQGQYKLINFNNGSQEFYDLIASPYETVDLVNSLTPAQAVIKSDLETEAATIRTDWSCRDLILNGSETTVDECSVQTCSGDNSTSTTNIGCCFVPQEPNIYQEWVEGDIRNIYTNDYPNHEFCNDNPNPTGPRYYLFEVDKTPTLSAGTTSVTNNQGRPARYYGVALNGVLMAPAPAVPFIFENPNTGEYNWDWVFEATNNQGSGMGRVSLDCASAHIGPQGYHYHGNMFEYVETIESGISSTTTPPASPVQIGWASDGFPILYRFGPDGAGALSELSPSYQLKPGDRPGDGTTAPCGPYNGKYTNDYEYVSGTGDLDECNGIERLLTLNTAQGQETFSYFYVVTAAFPQIGRCLQGENDVSFENDNQGSTEPFILPLNLLQFSVASSDAKLTADLRWLTDREDGVSHFVIERSLDGRDFGDVGNVSAHNVSGHSHEYEFRDRVGEAGNWYYRLKMVDLDGTFVYSSVRQISFLETRFELIVAPNPVGNYVYWTFGHAYEGDLSVSFFNEKGQLLLQQTHAGIAPSGQTIPVGDYTAGLYYLVVELADGKRIVKKVIKF